MSDKMLNYQQAAKLMGVPVGTVYSLVFQKRIPHVRLGSRLVRFSENTLVRWLAEHTVDVTAIAAQTANTR